MKNFAEQASEIKELVNKSQKFLIVSHLSPDADTVGAGCALLRYLENDHKEVTIFCADKLSEGVLFIPESWRYTNDQNILEKKYDLIFVVDSAGGPDRAGLEKHITKFKDACPVIVIDHHTDNRLYGTHNLVHSELSSTCEIISVLFEQWHYQPDAKTADCLISGIIYDTGSLTNPATRSSTVQTVSRLVSSGANLHSIINRTYNTLSTDRLKLWGLALSRLQKNERYNIVSTYITNQDLKKLNITSDALSGLANYLAVLKEARIILILREEGDGKIRGSLRTPFDNHNLQGLAQIFGGGGHQKSSGFTIYGKMIESNGTWKVA